MPLPAPTHVSKPKVLCVEDDAEIARVLRDILEESGFEPCSARSAREMDALLVSNSIDLVILDVMLPGEDGFSICRRLRSESTMPIIMVTARDEDIDRIVGLELGADDYVSKPFNSRELIARVRALLRRAEVPAAVARMRTKPLTFAGWRIDPTARELHDPENVRVSLTSVEFDLLLALCHNPGRTLSREQLLDLVHGGHVGSIDRSIDVHISRIRQKIELDPRDPCLIKTVRLGGYLFTPTVD